MTVKKPWDSELGIWTIFSFRDNRYYMGGSTPRNADHWTLSVYLGKLFFDVSFGFRRDTHYRMMLYWTDDKGVCWDRPRKHCRCYACTVLRCFH